MQQKNVQNKGVLELFFSTGMHNFRSKTAIVKNLFQNVNHPFKQMNTK